MAQRRIKSTADSKQKGSPSKAVKKAVAQSRPVRVRRTKPAAGMATVEEIRTHIEKLAYELYQRRGRQDGHDRQDWLEAERLTLASSALSLPRTSADEDPATEGT
ncbi:MAG TPA: DUF2934 domain-containing protein [Nitrospira sp.]|nr:DUF2934 domain-containing protein [Nitrospira sp.]